MLFRCALTVSVDSAEVRGDLFVGMPLRHQAQDRQLALGQRLVERVHRQVVRDVRAHRPAPGINGPDGIEQFPTDAVLEQIAGGTGPKGADDVRIARVGREHEDAGVAAPGV